MKNWQTETASWNLADFLHCALKTRWQRFGQFLNDFLYVFLHDFLYVFPVIFSVKILISSRKSEIFIIYEESE